jgi:Raf kinase inhibitor-like YbhB/YbcL family protein
MIIISIFLEGIMRLTSGSFLNNSNMPVEYAHTGVTGGKNISPDFTWAEFPVQTKSFVISMIDIHPVASNWVHWMIINIPKIVTSLEEGISGTGKMPQEALELVNSFGKNGYGGPEPPKGSGKHNYVITIYAISQEKINLSGRISESELIAKIRPFLLDKATHIGYFSR